METDHTSHEQQVSSDRPMIPGVVQISLTSRCQCNCLHCGVSEIKNKIPGEPTMEELIKLFVDLQQSGTQVIDLFGGEPTLRSDLFDIITLAKRHGFLTILETNGYRLNEEYVIGLKRAGLDQVYLSLDDYRESYHDEQRKLKGLFLRAVSAIGFCKTHNLPLDVSHVPKNRDDFMERFNTFLDFVFTKGAGRVRILLPRFTGNMRLCTDSPFADGKEQEIVGFIAPHYLNRVYFHSNDTPMSDISVCSAKKYFCHIMTNGDVIPCPYLPLVFGNIRQESIATIFTRIQQSPVMKRGGTHCLARDISFVNDILSHISPDKPFINMHEPDNPHITLER